MADGPRTKKSRVTKKGKKKFSGRKALVWLFFTAAIAVICGIIGYLLIILNGERILADNQDKFDLPEATTLYDSGGHEVTKLYVQNRENVEFAQIPPLMRDAFIATEDRRFEEHSGIDLWSIGRAIVKDVVSRSTAEGGSTITQQLAKNLFLNQDKTFFRKATEASIAVALEHKKTKDEILTMYLNRIYFGKTAYGVKAAAKVYFNKPLDELELWQIATLAAIPKAPSTYNPISNPENSKQRRAVVLQLMYDQKYITKEQMDQAKAVDYNPDLSSPNTQQYPAFVDYVINEAESRTGLSEEQLRSGGYKIFTTLNTKAQSVMEKEFADDKNFEKSVDDQQVQGAMIIVDHRDGNIQGLVGGRDYVKKGLNRVLVPRQPGSGFKPVTVYGPAIDSGDWFPWSIVQDELKCYGSYCPRDSNAVKYLGPITIRQSIKESRNASAVWLLNEIGVNTGLKFAEKLGFHLDDKKDRNLSIALGGLTRGVTPLQMATAFSAFANDGKSVDPHSVLSVIDTNGETIYKYNPPTPKQLMKPETAYYMTDIMEGVLERGGTGTQARIDRPVAGKTGTTQHGIPGYTSSYNRDAWFSGYTAEWTGVVWMGYDKTDKKHLLKKSSSQSAAMFGKVMEEAMKGMPVENFKIPKGLEEPPASISNFSAVYDAQSASVKLAWDPVQGEGMTYRVYRKEESEQKFTRLMDSMVSTGVDDMSVAPGLKYDYYVTAYNPKTQLESAPSAQLTVEVPAEQLTPVVPGVPGDGTAPGNGGQTPGNGGQTPGNGGQTPGNGGQTPGDGGQTPGNDGQTPGDGGQTPGDGGQTPGDGGQTPGSSGDPGNTPPAGDTAPSDGGGQGLLPGIVDPSGNGSNGTGGGSDQGGGGNKTPQDGGGQQPANPNGG
ncbi:PBP1A family penicillin-binding protein [Paenibacillus sp. sptzw28]|uniref:PBP1A family penicillin-binding protein n=1 Tax=Paenibacillus sp. sptzw28 TaxID=715179 RepID=UPI001C6DFFA7|nr:PBP1A family penicillin-binding protein [Paenibacillus sp. sptzw28]QYR23793.1 PBP1A family penicillin-binding protein [Paenibacillus sp. sptzw28]